MKRFLLAGVALLAAQAVHAADAVVDEVVVVDSAYNWSGVYIGAQVGYAWNDGFVNYSGYPDGQYAWNSDPDGVLGGLYAGGNWQMSNGLVLGAETEVNINSGSDNARYIDDYVLSDAGYYDMDVQLNWSGSTRLRVGYAMDRWMGYVTGGIAYAGYDVDLYGEANGDGNLLGWTAGAGVEYAMTDNWRVRLSYLYTDYGTDTFETYYNDGSGDYDGAFDLDMDTHALQIGVSYNW